MIYRTLRVDTLCTRSGSSWSTSCSLEYTQRQTTTSDRDNQIISSLTEILGHYIDLPKIPHPIYQQLCDSTTVETGQNSPKIRINWPYFGLGCERWDRTIAPNFDFLRTRKSSAALGFAWNSSKNYQFRKLCGVWVSRGCAQFAYLDLSASAAVSGRLLKQYLPVCKKSTLLPTGSRCMLD